MGVALVNGQILTDDAVIVGGSVTISDGLISGVHASGHQADDNDRKVSLGGRRLVPGFVDIQVNGGGGALFNESPDMETIRTIADAHVQFGTTGMLPTLISDDPAVMRQAMSAIHSSMRAGAPGILGIHLEGPFLNSKRKGAHDESKLRVIDDDAVDLLTSLPEEVVTLVTLAPELTTIARIRELHENNVIVFAGHTAASYEDCTEAEQAGLSGYTHLFNAMTPFTSREPGVVGAAVDSRRAVFGIIADGQHVHPVSFRLVCASKWRGGALLVTDAMPTVGSDEKSFALNGETIELREGVLRNAAGSLAGSHLSMIQAVRNAVRFAEIGWEEAVRMASTYPARAIGRNTCVGSIRPGCRADLIELTDELEIARVWRSGEIAFVNEQLGEKIA